MQRKVICTELVRDIINAPRSTDRGGIFASHIGPDTTSIVSEQGHYSHSPIPPPPTPVPSPALRSLNCLPHQDIMVILLKPLELWDRITHESRTSSLRTSFWVASLQAGANLEGRTKRAFDG